MQQIYPSGITPGLFALTTYALRFAHMIAKTAQERVKILAFWKKHGLAATVEAFAVSRSSLFAWQKQLQAGAGKLEVLNPQSTRPKRTRSRKAEWPLSVLHEIERLRKVHPNLGPEKVQIFLKPFCLKHSLRCPAPRTVARLIHDLGGLRVFPQKISHFGRIVPRKREKTLRRPKGFRGGSVSGRRRRQLRPAREQAGG